MAYTPRSRRVTLCPHSETEREGPLLPGDRAKCSWCGHSVRVIDPPRGLRFMAWTRGMLVPHDENGTPQPSTDADTTDPN